MELESYDYEPYDYGLEEEDFYENNPPIKTGSVRRVTFNKRVFAKVCIFKDENNCVRDHGNFSYIKLRPCNLDSNLR